MIFELFRTFKSPKFFRPAAEKILGTNKGGFLIKGGFLNINTPDHKNHKDILDHATRNHPSTDSPPLHSKITLSRWPCTERSKNEFLRSRNITKIIRDHLKMILRKIKNLIFWFFFMFFFSQKKTVTAPGAPSGTTLADPLTCRGVERNGKQTYHRFLQNKGRCPGEIPKIES